MDGGVSRREVLKRGGGGLMAALLNPGGAASGAQLITMKDVRILNQAYEAWSEWIEHSKSQIPGGSLGSLVRENLSELVRLRKNALAIIGKNPGIGESLIGVESEDRSQSTRLFPASTRAVSNKFLDKLVLYFRLQDILKEFSRKEAAEILKAALGLPISEAFAHSLHGTPLRSTLEEIKETMGLKVRATKKILNIFHKGPVEKLDAQDLGRFAFDDYWSQKLFRNPEALFNLLSVLEGLTEEGVDQPLVTVIGDQAALLAQARSLILNRNSGLSPIEMADLITKLEGGRLIHFIAADKVQSYLSQQGSLGVTVLQNDLDRNLAGAVNLYLEPETVRGKEDFEALAAAIPLGGILAAKLTKGIIDPAQQSTVLALPLKETIFPRAQVSFNGKGFVLEGVAGYLEFLLQTDAVLAQSA